MRGLRRRDAMNSYDRRIGPNMTPMVDVAMVILVFFMASASFAGPEWFLSAALRTATEGLVPTARPDPFALPEVEVRIELRGAAGGRTLATGMGLAGVPVEEMTERLSEFAGGAAAERLIVVLAPASDAGYDAVVRIQEACAELGIGRVELEMEE